MGKRSDFERVPRDFYPTPLEAVKPLFSHIEKGATFEEPCAGDGRLVDHLECHGGFLCMYCCDIEPQRPDVLPFDAFNIKKTAADYFITNPPWDRKVLHPLIEHLSAIAPTWLLFDADWCYTVQKLVAKRNNTKTVPELMKFCHKIVAVGRVSWEQNGKKGKDNCAWYLFDQSKQVETQFIGRAA